MRFPDRVSNSQDRAVWLPIQLETGECSPKNGGHGVTRARPGNVLAHSAKLRPPLTQLLEPRTRLHRRHLGHRNRRTRHRHLSRSTHVLTHQPRQRRLGSLPALIHRLVPLTNLRHGYSRDRQICRRVLARSPQSVCMSLSMSCGSASGHLRLCSATRRD
jgi:hypothetical protein